MPIYEQVDILVCRIFTKKDIEAISFNIRPETTVERRKKASVGGRILLAVCGLVIASLLVIIIFLLKDQRKDVDTTVNEAAGRGTVVNEENAEDVLNQMMGKQVFAAPTTYDVTMNSTWYFSDGKSASDNAYVENSKSNKNNVCFDVVRLDTEEVIYKSPILPVEAHVEGIVLDTELPDGTYDCIVTYYLLDDEGNSLATVNVALTIVVGQ